MDIAKIRKKLKEIEGERQQSKVNGQAIKASEDQTVKSDEKIPELQTRPESHQVMPEPELIDAKVEMKQKPVEFIDKEKMKSKDESNKVYESAVKVESEKTEEVIEILTFSLLNGEFAFRISQLLEILRYQWITEVPNVPNYILGITSLRGKVIPVIDLKLKLSLSDKQSDNKKGKILIIKGTKGPIGITVDKVIGVVRIAKSEILPPPSHLSEAELKFIDGIAIVDKRFISIINMEEAIALNLK